MSLPQIQDGAAPGYFGLYPAIVMNLLDPEDLGRIEVSFPWLGDAGQDVSAWATVLSPYADASQGLQILPEPGSQVVVAFEAGNPRRPYVVGACWNGREELPEDPEQANNLRVLRTRSGSELRFDDTEGGASVTLSTRSGHKLEMKDTGSQVELKHSGNASIKIDSAGNITITALASVTINAPSGLTVTAPTATFTGSITCVGITTPSVTSGIYTQGAGNIW